jgi:hypothetical protein
MASDTIVDSIQKSFSISGDGIFGMARVIGRNDDTNQTRVRIYPLSETKDFKYIENNHVEEYPFAETLSMAKGENHGIYCAPEFGDFVLFTKLPMGTFIIGSVVNPSWEYAAMNIPVEAQNMQENGTEYNVSHWPDLNKKGYHLKEPKIGDVYQPASFLQRWRRNDILMYNTTKIGKQEHSAAKLMEFRSAENNFLQLVDIGNFNTKPGIDGKNSKKYSPVRQTDYRDLWEGFTINREFWTERTDKPPKTNESNYIKLATNNSMGANRDRGCDKKDADWKDTGKDYPDLVRGEVRLDNRESDGAHETSKTYCPTYQTLKHAMGPDRYYQDKEGEKPWDASIPYRFKVKKWIEDTGKPYDPKAQHFNVGHFLTLSNTIFKRRAMLATAKGHQIVMSDIDKDEKLLINSHRGKFIYMEDSAPGNYENLWVASQKHHMVFVDHMAAPFLVDDKGKERHKMVDPNQGDGSTFQLIQTEKAQKIWLADSGKCPRIHVHTTGGHEALFLDNSSFGRKIQFTTSDKKEQILMDEKGKNIIITNHNNNVSIYAKNNITLHAKNMIIMRADSGYDIQSSGGSYAVTACGISHTSVCGAGAVPEAVRGSVGTKISVTEGSLINKYDPS